MHVQSLNFPNGWVVRPPRQSWSFPPILLQFTPEQRCTVHSSNAHNHYFFPPPPKILLVPHPTFEILVVLLWLGGMSRAEFLIGPRTPPFPKIWGSEQKSLGLTVIVNPLWICQQPHATSNDISSFFIIVALRSLATALPNMAIWNILIFIATKMISFSEKQYETNLNFLLPNNWKGIMDAELQ